MILQLAAVMIKHAKAIRDGFKSRTNLRLDSDALEGGASGAR
jgi:hypothetical protein